MVLAEAVKLDPGTVVLLLLTALAVWSAIAVAAALTGHAAGAGLRAAFGWTSHPFRFYVFAGGLVLSLPLTIALVGSLEPGWPWPFSTAVVPFLWGVLHGCRWSLSARSTDPRASGPVAPEPDPPTERPR